MKTLLIADFFCFVYFGSCAGIRTKKLYQFTGRDEFKPEFGVSKKLRFYAEAYIGAWFYSDNNEFLETKVLTQESVCKLQLHAIYTFKNQMWVGIDGNRFNGGKTSVNNQSAGDFKDNKQIGAAGCLPIAKKQSLKLQFHAGLFKDIDYKYKTRSLTYQHIFF
ncbi:MAG: hypothetical protein ABIT08_12685 [Bacteroidia bacterium]